MKVCSKCKRRKHRSKFPKRSGATDGLLGRCFVCYNKEKAAWRERHPDKYKTITQRYRDKDPEKIRDNNLRNKYGISLDDYNRLLAKQGGVCAICSQPERMKNGRSGKVSPLAVDHCHGTGRVRGLLCFSCNVALGKFNDDPKILKKALDYVTPPR